MREIDRLTSEHYQIPSLQLMLAAAKACYQAIDSHFSNQLRGKKALIICGPGNNGGDGAALAIELHRAGMLVDVILLGTISQTRGDALANFQALQEIVNGDGDGPGTTAMTLVEWDGVANWETITPSGLEYDLVVDALFGTGLKRPLTGTFEEAVNYLNAFRRDREGAAPLIVSVDIPSGHNADMPSPIGPAVQADLTVTFTAPKLANVLPPASHLNGRLVVARIGSPVSLIEAAKPAFFVVEETDVRRWLRATRYTPDSFKNSHGHVLIVAGSRGYTGAAVLAGNAAMRSGAGLVTIATPASAQSTIDARVMPEVMTVALAETDRGAVSDEAVDHALGLATKADVLAIGPGLSAQDERTRRFVHSVVSQRRTPIVIDADGLNCLSPWPTDLQGSLQFPLILTPHQGEMLRLMGTTDKTMLQDRVAAVREFAIKHHVILVLKGSRSLIAAPDGRVFINPTGNPGAGTAGSGDTLTGFIAGFLAQSTGKFFDEAGALFGVIAALYAAGLAADFAARTLGMRAMVASDIREHFSQAIRSIDSFGETP